MKEKKIILINISLEELIKTLPKNVVLIETDEKDTYKYFRLNKKTMKALKEKCTP